VSRVLRPRPSRSPGVAALTELRRSRRIHRLGETTRGDVAYQVYVTTLFSLFGVFTATGLVGDEPVRRSTVDTVLAHAPAWLGLAAALAFASGVRIGSRGGPLAIEAPDVQHVLLAPIPRRDALRRPVLRTVLRATMWSALLGGIAGDLVAQRFPGSDTSWIASGALVAASVAALAVGAALLVAGRSVPVIAPALLAAALVLWSVADVAGTGPTAPATHVGRIATWPLDFTSIGMVAPALALVLVGVAAQAIEGLSIERARRRTALIGQLRFAVTQQDLRTVLVLRRQLANEVPRRRGRFPALAGPVADRLPVLARDLASYARWPVIRIARVAGFGAAIGLSLRGVWSGTTPLVLVAGAAAFLAALDAIQPLAEDLDRPTRLRSFPRPEGWVLIHHLAGSGLTMLGVGGVALATAVAIDPSMRVAGLGAIALVPAACAAVAGAAVSVISEPLLDAASEAMVPPEVAGPRVLLRAAWPPAIAVIGMLPVVAAHRAWLDGQAPAPVLVSAAAAVLVLVTLVGFWVRFRREFYDKLRESFRSTEGAPT
jgi:hypothetical protein